MSQPRRLKDDQQRINPPPDPRVAAEDSEDTENMEIEHVPESSARIEARIEETVRAAREYAEAARAPNTLRAYASDIEDFSTYCRVELGGAVPLPADPETVTLYITDLAKEEPVGRDLKVSTIGRRLASISAWHKRAGFPSPTEDRLVRETMKGIRRKKGSRSKRAAPITVGVLTRVLKAIRTHDKKTGALLPAALRDRALLLMGFAGSFRRAEISDLRVSDLEFFEGRGLVVEVRASKTDAEGEGAVVGIPYGDHELTCPITAVNRWLEFSDRSGEDHLFCRIDRHGNLKEGGISGDGINELVKKRVKNAGLDATRYSGHSLRAGLPTSASEEKVGMEAGVNPYSRTSSQVNF
jgi:site-specific recombinase XerD